MTQMSEKEQQENNDYIAVCMHNILAKIGGNKQSWLDLGYGQTSESIEDIVGNVLKVLAEVDCEVAITEIVK